MLYWIAEIIRRVRRAVRHAETTRRPATGHETPEQRARIRQAWEHAHRRKRERAAKKR